MLYGQNMNKQNYIQYTDDAFAELKAINDYLYKKNAEAAVSVIHTIRRLIEYLPDFPYMGTSVIGEFIRCLITPKYRYKIFYRIIEQKETMPIIQILHVVHSKVNFQLENNN